MFCKLLEANPFFFYSVFAPCSCIHAYVQVFHHAILNLPDSALTFLDTFRGVDWRANGFDVPPTVHVYCFSKAADPKQASLWVDCLLDQPVF